MGRYVALITLIKVPGCVMYIPMATGDNDCFAEGPTPAGCSLFMNWGETTDQVEAGLTSLSL